MFAENNRFDKKVETSNDEYQTICKFLNDSCGIVLGDTKQYLVQNRLSPLLKKFDLANFAELVKALQSSHPSSRKINSAVIDAMTTNETYWYRDLAQFEALKNTVFPELLKQKTGTIKVWSAACSTGQEPYTISICAAEAVRASGRGKNIQIIGTDISETVLAEAKNAVYSELALSRGIESGDRERLFVKTHQGYKLKSEVSQNVRFQQFNLLKPFSVLGRFDVIFCRNVLIYFADDVKRDILQRMAAALETGGYLFLSTTESMPSGLKEYQAVKSNVRYFRKID